MEVTEVGIVTDASWLLSNTQSPMEVTEEGIVTDVRRLLLNAYLPMEVTEEGIVTDVKPLPVNALYAMEVTEDGIYNSLPITVPDEFFRVVITEPFVSFSISPPSWVLKVVAAGNALLLVLRSKAWEIVTSVRPMLSAKAKSPRDVTPVGMKTDVRLLLRNAEAPMEVKEEEIYKSLPITTPDEFFRVVITEPFVSFSISPPP